MALGYPVKRLDVLHPFLCYHSGVARPEPTSFFSLRYAAKVPVRVSAPGCVAAPDRAGRSKESNRVSRNFKTGEVQADYRLAVRSRETSILGRKEVLTGKAKFGVFGDGKEIAQLALARSAQPGDWRSGYYRDQTFMMATGVLTVEAFFAQLYADADANRDPASAGRQMNAHFASRLLDADGQWRSQLTQVNSAADSSPTGSQMPRLVGLTYASRLYRELEGLADQTLFSDLFSDNGNEVTFGTIGNASCAEGIFWEAINAVGVLGGPLVMSIWDDGFGISVPNEVQITKADLGAILLGFARTGDGPGFALHVVPGWDYAALREIYAEVTEEARNHHRPSIIHVVELTQPQGHSTSGSHERYKSEERLAWENERDCLHRMRAWMIETGYTTNEQLETIEAEERLAVRAAQEQAWAAFNSPILDNRATVIDLVGRLTKEANETDEQTPLNEIVRSLERVPNPVRRNLVSAAHKALVLSRSRVDSPAREALEAWWRDQHAEARARYSTHLYSESAERAEAVAIEPPRYDESAPLVNGFEVLNKAFDAALARRPEVLAFGEDLGKLGDVNQGFSGLQARYGSTRVADTGIRECTIIGQAIGLALRGLRPIAEIQYLDYVLYALQIISDDLATLQYRTRGGQKAPVIIRTRGHRLEGIWHSGSPMAGILGLVRGVHVCVPRNMTQASGMYNTLLQSDESAIVIEVLNGYRRKERLPDNVGSFTVPLGKLETLRSGDDVTLVTYGACCPIALEAAERLAALDIGVEVIDVQTLLPFDRDADIVASLKRTNRLVVLDEDVPGGGSAYILRNVLETQGGFHWLDAEPVTLTAQAHRPAYGSDGDYWSKPNTENVFDAVYGLMHRDDPTRFPAMFS